MVYHVTIPIPSSTTKPPAIFGPLCDLSLMFCLIRSNPVKFALLSVCSSAYAMSTIYSKIQDQGINRQLTLMSAHEYSRNKH